MDKVPGPITKVSISGASTALGAATTGFQWRLIALVISCAATVTVKFTSDGSDITGTAPNTTGAFIVLPPSSGWIEGTAAKDLTIVGSGNLNGWALVQKCRSDSSAGGY